MMMNTISINTTNIDNNRVEDSPINVVPYLGKRYKVKRVQMEGRRETDRN